MYAPIGPRSAPATAARASRTPWTLSVLRVRFWPILTCPLALKRSRQPAGRDQRGELLGRCPQAGCSLKKSRQPLLNEAENLLHALPEAIRARLPAGKHVEPRLRACATLTDEM